MSDSRMARDRRLVDEAAVHRTLRAVKTLRFNVGDAFEHLACGNSSEDGDHQLEFLGQAERNLKKIESTLRILDNAANSMVAPPQPETCNAGLLSMETDEETAALYLDTVKAYKWTSKLQQASSYAYAILARTRTTSRRLPREKDKEQCNQQAQRNTRATMELIKTITQSIGDFSIEVHNYGASIILMVTLGRTLKAVLVLREAIIEYVVVRAYTEEFLTEDGQIDIWSSSRYKVFQKVTDRAEMTLLNIPLVPIAQLRMFLAWFRSYKTLFSAPCTKCGLYLRDFQPPIGRELPFFSAFHETCTPPF